MNEPRPDTAASRYFGFEAIPIRVTVSVGPLRCKLGDIGRLAPGDVIQLEREIGEPFDLRCGDVLLGRVELLNDGGRIAVKLVRAAEEDDGLAG